MSMKKKGLLTSGLTFSDQPEFNNFGDLGNIDP